jgi:FAD/FMN-containing dehydrogenase
MGAAMNSVNHAARALVAALRAIVGDDGLRTDEQIALLDRGYGADNLAARIMVSPGDTDQLARVVACCAAHGRAVVPHGGLTGLVGGASSREDDVIVSLRRMNRIVAIDTASSTVTVEAGVTLAQLSDALHAAGLDLGIDLASRDSATIGGLIAHNAGGIRAFRHGMMRERVLGIEVVLADGRVYRDLNALTKNNTGYDLKQLFIGSDGTLGIVTRAALKLTPLQTPAATALLGIENLDAAIELAHRLRTVHHGRLLALEIMWHGYAACVRQAHPELAALGLTDCPLYLIVEVAHDVALDMNAQLEDLLGSALEDGVLTDCVLAHTRAQREKIWLLREDSDAVAHQGAFQLSFDVALPVPELDCYVRALSDALARFDPAIKVFVFGHFLDGNLHIMLAADRELATRHEAIEHLIYERLPALGGSLSAEHGIGVEKKAALRRYGDPLRLALMADLRRLFDARGTLNPGKMIDV